MEQEYNRDEVGRVVLFRPMIKMSQIDKDIRSSLIYNSQ